MPGLTSTEWDYCYSQFLENLNDSIAIDNSSEKLKQEAFLHTKSKDFLLKVQKYKKLSKNTNKDDNETKIIYDVNILTSESFFSPTADNLIEDTENLEYFLTEGGWVKIFNTKTTELYPLTDLVEASTPIVKVAIFFLHIPWQWLSDYLESTLSKLRTNTSACLGIANCVRYDCTKFVETSQH